MHASMTTTTSAAPVAELRRAVKRYGKVTALDGVDLAVRAGELTAVLGPNGAGKTTAIKLLLGLARPTSGRGSVIGADPTVIETRLRVAAMPPVGRVAQALRARGRIAVSSSHYSRSWPM